MKQQELEAHDRSIAIGRSLDAMQPPGRKTHHERTAKANKRAAHDPKFATYSTYVHGVQFGAAGFLMFAISVIPTFVLAIWLSVGAGIAMLGAAASFSKIQHALKVNVPRNYPSRLIFVMSCVVASILVKAIFPITIALVVVSAFMFRSASNVKQMVQEAGNSFKRAQMWFLVCMIPAIFIYSVFANRREESLPEQIFYFAVIAIAVFILLKIWLAITILWKAKSFYKQVRFEVATFLEMQEPRIPSTRSNVDRTMAQLDAGYRAIWCGPGIEAGFDAELIMNAPHFPLPMFVSFAGLVLVAPFFLVVAINECSPYVLSAITTINNIREGDEGYALPTARNADGMNDVAKV